MNAHARIAYRVLDGRGTLSGAPRRAPNNWGATEEEMRTRFACDEIVFPAHERYFRAVTVRAPEHIVFRWLCQLRAAPYSYDWIDNFGRPSPRELTPGLGDLTIGDPVMRIFALRSFERDRHLTAELTDEHAKRVFGDLAITYAIVPHEDHCRLVAKFVVRYPRSAIGRAMRLLLPWGDLVMARKQLLTLKSLAERHARTERPIEAE
jgi:hypothetical protein